MPRVPLCCCVERGRTATSHHPTTLPSASATRCGAPPAMLSRTYFRVSASGGASSSARYLRSRATLSTAALEALDVLLGNWNNEWNDMRHATHSARIPAPKVCSQFFPSLRTMIMSSSVPSSRQRAFTL